MPSSTSSLFPSTATLTPGLMTAAGTTAGADSGINFKPTVSTDQSVGAGVVTPTVRMVDPAKETVSGQVQNLMASDSNFLQQARTRANQQMNKRGLMNSSMAIGASEDAAYNAALPIAQADATAYQAAASENAKAINTAALANLDAQTKYTLGEIEANYKTLMQANASVGALYQDAIKNISTIISAGNMSGAAKKSAIKNQLDLLKTGMGVFGAMNGLNLSDLLNFDDIAIPGSDPLPSAGAPASGAVTPSYSYG